MAYKSLQPNQNKYKSFQLPAFSSLFSTKPQAQPNIPSVTAPIYPTPTGAPIPPKPIYSPVTNSPAPRPPVTPAMQGYVNTMVQTPQPPTPTTTSANTSVSPDVLRDYLSAYGTAMKPSEEYKTALLNSSDLESQIEERKLKSRREYETALDTPGMLKAGAEATANQGRYRNDQNLADLAIQQSAADRRVQALTGIQTANRDALKPLQIGDNYYDPSTGQLIPSNKAPEDFSLSEGQARYRLNPTTGQYEKIASLGKTTAGS